MTMHTRFLTLSTLLLVLLTACTGRRTTADTQAETDLPAICQRDTLVALTLYSSTSYFLYRGEPWASSMNYAGSLPIRWAWSW